MDRWRARLNRPRDAASLAVFRMLFGLVMAGGVVRYFASGWIDRFYVRPTFHFHYWGFDWVEPLPAPWIHVAFAVLGVASLCIALGLFYRAATVVFAVLFHYVHLLDVTNYLNHYYLVGLLALIFCVLPLHRTWSLDARRKPALRAETLPAWMLYLLRFQVGLVYVFAALAKLGPDWLLHGQPLSIWLHSRTDTPVIGPYLDEPLVALAMSWAGFLYDLTIVGWLSWRRTRPFAYAVVCVFHFFTAVFFNIGIFPVLMTAVATIFFSPSWPRRWVAWVAGRAERRPGAAPPARWRLPGWGAAALGVWALFHLAVPLRAHLYGGNLLWHEQGMRWSWRVMVREKNGAVSYRVRTDGRPRERIVEPRRYLNREQEMEFAGQPDLILQLAHRIRDDLEAEGHRDVEVRADAWVSLNGRPSTRLIDPGVDLASVEDGVAPAGWILPAPGGPPRHLRSYREHLALRPERR
ncbi:MAG TPA: HTTM domain-containing protein [Sandaracinaceae bacterium LLY-WYZ-13_1]|nr:HTTM domain-containing protein [Sandaracinaceae bacterium LLY-WYZ-13_1]